MDIKTAEETINDEASLKGERRRIIAQIRAEERTRIKAIVEGMIVDEKEAKFENDPENLLGEGYAIGYNRARNDLLSHIDTDHE